jgi:glycolate dehydrogenase FAD-binding subunit
VTPAPDPVSPTTADEVAAALRRAADARQTIAIRGAGTKGGWGRAGARADTILDMRSLNRVLAHEHGDMTATVEAGATLSDVNRALALHRQWLPLDPPFAGQATIGGILATNDSGPLRHRYGTPRDLVIGVQLATTDGALSKAGGRVVKNVAGYDLGKLVAGSFGSLAVIVSATFKLSPIPAASKTLRIDVADAGALARAVGAVMKSPLEPIAFEIAALPVGRRFTGRRDDDGEPGRLALHLLVRFASLAVVAGAQIEQARTLVKADAANTRVLDGDAEQSAWREHAESIWTGDGAIARASWLPANIARVVDEIGDAALIGRAGVGAGLVQIAGDEEQQARTIERLRASSFVGNVVVVRAPDAVKRRVDVWGSHGDRQPLFESLKRAFDPAGVLNPGRGPL